MATHDVNELVFKDGGSTGPDGDGEPQIYGNGITDPGQPIMGSITIVTMPQFVQTSIPLSVSVPAGVGSDFDVTDKTAKLSVSLFNSGFN